MRPQSFSESLRSVKQSYNLRKLQATNKSGEKECNTLKKHSHNLIKRTEHKLTTHTHSSTITAVSISAQQSTAVALKASDEHEKSQFPCAQHPFELRQVGEQLR
ncbi:hypothetical protein TRVL_03390 [Trypanosoma vivax]|nr:hypothetical protein TRVL_03390 [Trypanosoma vivax]